MIRRHGAFFWSVLVLTAISLVLIAIFYLNADYGTVDTVETNRVKTGLELGLKPEKGKYDFVAFRFDGSVAAQSMDTSERSYSERVNDAICAGDTLIDYRDGKIMFKTGLATRLAPAREQSLWTSAALVCFVFLLFLYEVIYLDRRIFMPFRKLERFSIEVAKGNFDSPLSMDRGHNFGAFTEAFDLMRQNLQDAKRETEEALESKRMLLAELGHDIRTPLSSILAAAELNATQGVKGMTVIVEKAKQIDKLLTDIYEISLEEVSALRVEPIGHPTDVLVKSIRSADLSHSVAFGNEPPDAIVKIDKLRFEECVDNVLLNARKYAEGTVNVKFGIQNGLFWISFHDNGAGVDAEELAFVTDKFYRGKTARNKTGAGLGLFITKCLLEKMGGSMRAENDNGFLVTFYLPLAE